MFPFPVIIIRRLFARRRYLYLRGRSIPMHFLPQSSRIARRPGHDAECLMFRDQVASGCCHKCKQMLTGPGFGHTRKGDRIATLRQLAGDRRLRVSQRHQNMSATAAAVAESGDGGPPYGKRGLAGGGCQPRRASQGFTRRWMIGSRGSPQRFRCPSANVLSPWWTPS
jgi:hypothetical protein